MRALVLAAEHEMPVISEVPTPEPGENEILVKVTACGINYADTMMRRGTYLSKPKFPFVPGFEFSGIVARASGPWSEGDPVMGIGARCYSEFVTTPASALMPVPAGFTAEQAAAFPVTYLTAMAMLRLSAKAGPEDTILIHAAAGGVGTAAIQLAKAMGLTVIATASSEEKLALARSLGADFTVNYSTSSFVEPVKEFTAGRGVDIIFESLGGDALQRDIEVTAPFGRIVVFGSASAPTTEPKLNAMYNNSIGISAFWMRTLMNDQRQFNEVLSELIEIVDRHGLRPIIGQVYRLEDGALAWRDLESRKSTGKLILKP